MSGAVPAQGSIVSFAMQNDYIGSGAFTPGTMSWHKMRAPAHDLGTVQDQQIFPLETGGPMTPSGSFKQGVFYAGTIDMIPRVEDNFGYILLAAMGEVSSITDRDADGNAVVGVNTHIFRFKATDHAYQPWMSWRRLIPGNIAGDYLGESGYDAKVAGLRFTFPNQGKVAARASVFGSVPVLETAPAWSYANANFEDTLSTVDAGNGQFKLGATQYPLLGASFDLVNQFPQLAQMMTIGSFNPSGIVALTRSATIRLAYRYEDPKLYRKILTGSDVGTTWSPLPYFDKTTGGVYAVDGRFKSPSKIGATNVNYELRVRVNRITWAADSAIQIQAGNIITQTFTGTAEQPTDGSNYLEVVLVNGKASYTA